MPKVLSATACNLDADILAASLPLLEESRIEAIEWSFDALYNVKQIPSWFMELLTTFGNEKRLIGHGVFFSLFSGKWSQGQRDWLKHLKQISSQFQFDHITEHFGFMTGEDFHQGAPLTIPYTTITLEIGRDRLKRIHEACGCPVGLENLAFSYSLNEVKRHGEFLAKLLEPVNGFIILDLHNFYCQLHNFNITYEELINLYPLDKVREIHISGGSWDESGVDPGRTVRRDTHDDSVPQEVFDLLEKTIDRCPHLKYVVLEQLGNGLLTYESKRAFYHDFKKMQQIVNSKNHNRPENSTESFLPLEPLRPDSIIESESLYRQQLELSSILESSASYNEVKNLLNNSSLAHSDWRIEEWEPYMVETAIRIARKWRRGFEFL